jgi:uncharacterized protein
MDSKRIMKRTLLCLLAAFLLAGGLAAAAQSGVTEISASGAGSVSLPPDIATVDAAVSTNSSSAGDAVSQNNQSYERIVGGLVKIGIGRDDIALGYYNVRHNPKPQNMPANPSEEYGYTVTRSFEVKVREVGKAGTVSDACIAAGATAIGRISFGLANPAAARAQAMAKAVADARLNAEALARATGLRIVSIKSIGYPDAGLVPPGMGAIARVNTHAPTNLDESNVSESASVRIVFLAEP